MEQLRKTVLTDAFGRLLAYAENMPAVKPEKVDKEVVYDDPFSDEPKPNPFTFDIPDGVEPNLVTSRTLSGKHMPVLDLDFPCRLLPSQTPGHFHLYIDKEIEKWQLEGLLRHLKHAGLVQEAWVRNLRHNNAVAVRIPS